MTKLREQFYTMHYRDNNHLFSQLFESKHLVIKKHNVTIHLSVLYLKSCIVGDVNFLPIDEISIGFYNAIRSKIYPTHIRAEL